MNKVIWKILKVHVLFYLIVFLCYSCSMLKNTSKEKSKEVKESRKTNEEKQLDLSQLYRETQRYSYRPDGTVAAYEFEKERIDAASWKHRNAEEKQSSTSTAIREKSSPTRLMMLAGIIIIVVASYLIWKKIK